MVAAGEMDVDRPVERDARLAPLRDLLGVRLVSEAANLQPALPVQATRPARIEVALVVKSERLDRGVGGGDLVVGHVGDEEVLPDRQADIAVAKTLGDLGEAAHLCRGEPCRPAGPRRSSSGPPVSAVHADMGRTIKGRARRDRLGRNARQLAAELFLDLGDEFLEAPGIEHVFKPRLVAVGAVAVLDKDADDGVGDLRRFLGLTMTPVSRAKSLWPVMPPSVRRNQTPGSTPKPPCTSTA